MRGSKNNLEGSDESNHFLKHLQTLTGTDYDTGPEGRRREEKKHKMRPTRVNLLDFILVDKNNTHLTVSHGVFIIFGFLSKRIKMPGSVFAFLIEILSSVQGHFSGVDVCFHRVLNVIRFNNGLYSLYTSLPAFSS